LLRGAGLKSRLKASISLKMGKYGPDPLGDSKRKDVWQDEVKLKGKSDVFYQTMAKVGECSGKAERDGAGEWATDLGEDGFCPQQTQKEFHTR